MSEFSQAGVFVRTFGKDVAADGAMSARSCGGQRVAAGQPAVGVSGSGDVYVAERDNRRVSEFSQAGVFVRAFGKDVGGSGMDVCTSSCVVGQRRVAARASSTRPGGLAVSGSGDV